MSKLYLSHLVSYNRSACVLCTYLTCFEKSCVFLIITTYQYYQHFIYAPFYSVAEYTYACGGTRSSNLEFQSKGLLVLAAEYSIDVFHHNLEPIKTLTFWVLQASRKLPDQVLVKKCSRRRQTTAGYRCRLLIVSQLLEAFKLLAQFDYLSSKSRKRPLQGSKDKKSISLPYKNL